MPNHPHPRLARDSSRPFFSSPRKIALGTVQFGLDYGISNVSGKVPAQDVGAILLAAQQAGIDTLDTAQAYGDSEVVLGRHDLSPFHLITKLPAGDTVPAEALNSSLHRLNQPSVYGYLVHSFASFQAFPNLWREMLKLKADGLVARIGASLYRPEELAWLMAQKVLPDLVQVPYNLFDRRFEPYLAEAQQAGVEIHTRSAFLQGLFFKHPAKLPAHFEAIRAPLQRLRTLCEAHKLQVHQLCLGFCLLQPQIDRVVIGVDSLQQFSQNLQAFDHLATVADLYDELTGFEIHDEPILNPASWP